MKKLLKNLALTLPPVRRVYVDLQNRRRRVDELEGHLKVMKKQMSRSLKTRNFGSAGDSALNPDIKHIETERKKLAKQNKTLQKKYDTLYRDYCILSMSNESLTKVNASLITPSAPIDNMPISPPLKVAASNTVKTNGTKTSSSKGSSRKRRA